MQACVLFSVFSNLANAYYSWGPCPSISISKELEVSILPSNFLYHSKNFVAQDYLGRWFERQRCVDFPFAKGNCSQAYYFVGENGKTFATNSEIVTGKNVSVTGEFFFNLEVHGQGYFKISTFAPLGDYKIIHTDYKNSALVFSCTSLGIFHWKWAWVLVKDLAYVVPEFYRKMNEDFGIPLANMMKTNHEECSKLA